MATLHDTHLKGNALSVKSPFKLKKSNEKLKWVNTEEYYEMGEYRGILVSPYSQDSEGQSMISSLFYRDLWKPNQPSSKIMYFVPQNQDTVFFTLQSSSGKFVQQMWKCSDKSSCILQNVRLLGTFWYLVVV